MRTDARRRAAAVAASLVLLSLSAATTARATGGSTPQPAATALDVKSACVAAPQPGAAACLSLIRTDVAQRLQPRLAPHQAPSGFGYGPAALQNAYLLPSANAGSGQTVAIVDAFDYPSAEADLATYRAAWDLPPCTSASGCFRKVNQDGQDAPLPPAAGGTGWATEEALDIEMASAVCPNCDIVLVEANSALITDLGSAVNTAVAMGVHYVSNSYGAPEYDGEGADDTAYYTHPGAALTVASGDDGFGVQFPSSSPHVVSVGGTSLTTAANARGWAEAAWNGAGSGCSKSQPKPGWQVDPGCANRVNTDVSAVADPATGVAVYDTYDRTGWLQVGGTSVAAPIIASVYALVGTPPAAESYPASYLYAHASGLNDVTTGTNGSCAPTYLCTAGPGYDGPTGLGTPNGVGAFGAPSGNIVTLANPGDQDATQDVPFSLQMRATDTDAGQVLTFSATGLPNGLSIDSGSGLVSGTPTGVGDNLITITATDGTDASASAKFTIRVASPVRFAGPGAQASYVGQPVRLAVPASDAVAGRTLTYSAGALPAGLSLDPATGVVTGLPTGGYTAASVSAQDSAGRSSDDPFIWYVAPAQVSARTGTIHLGRDCLDARAGITSVAACTGRASQLWTVEPDGTVAGADGCLTTGGTLSPCTATAAQQWRIASFGELVNPASGTCLTGSPAGGVGVALCTGTASQRWTAPPGPIVSAVTGMCADTGSATSGHLQVWYCATTDAQAWVVQPDGTVRVGRECLAATGGDARLDRCDGSAAQQWRVRPDGTVVHQASGDCLADPGDNAVVATRLITEPCRSTAGQLWHIE
jgi:Ricin-type beta-trefoil lectin domain/Putative Ig domain